MIRRPHSRSATRYCGIALRKGKTPRGALLAFLASRALAEKNPTVTMECPGRMAAVLLVPRRDGVTDRGGDRAAMVRPRPWSAPGWCQPPHLSRSGWAAEGRKTRRVRVTEKTAQALWSLRCVEARRRRPCVRDREGQPDRPVEPDAADLEACGCNGRRRGLGRLSLVPAYVCDEAVPRWLERGAGAEVPRPFRSGLHDASLRASARRRPAGAAHGWAAGWW